MKPHRYAERMVWGVVILLVLIGIAIVVRRAVQLVPILINGYTPPAAGANGAAVSFTALDDLFARYSALTLMHIIPGLLFVLLGPLQFSRRLRRRQLRWHRRIGRTFLVCGAVVGVTALVMSLGMPAIGGVNQAAATTLFAIFFLFALGNAFRHILRREVELHREWMIRAFAIGLAVTTIRPIIGMFFATSVVSGLTPAEFFGTGFWIGFVLHLIAAEAWIYWTRAQTLPGAVASSQ